MEKAMKIVFKSDQNGIEFQVEINWKSLRAMLKALLPLITTLFSLVAAPEVARLGSYFGWW
jgi:hypothetical protein